MKRTLILVSIFAVLIIVGLSLWTRRSNAVSPAGAPAGPAVNRIIVPPGTGIRVRLVEGISEGSKPGDTLQALVADSVFVNYQLVIPADTRALVSTAGIRDRKDGMADVTVQLKELIFSDRHVPVRSNPVTIRLERLSDFDLITRAAGGIVGGAVGAARSASVGRNPSVGAGAIGVGSAGRGTEEKDEDIVLFHTVEPLDLTGVRW
jgi:uncharacterized protein YcfJ